MCGILGFISDDIQHPGEAHQFISALLEQSRVRGRDASGFAAIVDGQDFVTDKHPMPAQDFVNLSKRFRSLRQSNSISMIAHTRAATNGTPKNNQNNHPFHGPRYSMVHNGGIWHFRQIARKYGINLQTDCDSELILHFLEGQEEMRDGIVSALNALEAVSFMAVASLDRNNGDVHLFRNLGSPCVVMRVKRWNAVVFASTLDIIMRAGGQVFGDKNALWEWADLEYGSGKELSIPSNTHVTIHPDGTFSDEDVDSLVIPDRTFSSSHYYYGSYYDSDVAAFSGNTTSSSGSVTSGDSSHSCYPNSPKCGRCGKFVKKSGAKYSIGNTRVCPKCYRKAANVGPVEISSSNSQWNCIECGRSLEESLGDVKEVGREYVCYKCWYTIDHAKLANQGRVLKGCKACGKVISVKSEDAVDRITCVCYSCWEDDTAIKNIPGAISVYTKPPKIRDSSSLTSPTESESSSNIEIDIAACMPLELKNEFGHHIPTIIDEMTDLRTPVDDYGMNDEDVHTYLRLRKNTLEDNFTEWEDMTLDRVDQMNDGEYLAYIQFLEAQHDISAIFGEV